MLARRSSNPARIGRGWVPLCGKGKESRCYAGKPKREDQAQPSPIALKTNAKLTKRRLRLPSDGAYCSIKPTTCTPADGGAFISLSYFLFKSDAYGHGSFHYQVAAIIAQQGQRACSPAVQVLSSSMRSYRCSSAAVLQSLCIQQCKGWRYNMSAITTPPCAINCSRARSSCLMRAVVRSAGSLAAK